MKELEIGKVKVSELVNKYQTPLYVYDEGMLENIMKTYITNFKSNKFKTKVLFASKAFSTTSMVKLVNENGLGLDVVSGGELFTAINAKMDMEKVYFHGNNKQVYEFEMAFNNSLKHIVIDNYLELELLEKLAKEYNKHLNVMLRLNVGVEAHTHEYIITAHVDSKFGMAYMSNDYLKCLELLENSQNLELEGFHAHIGSQIFDMTAFYAEIDKMVKVLKDFNKTLSLNIGGGFGVKYTVEDKPIPIAEVCKMIINHTEDALKLNNVKINELIIEPGRSIVAEAGYTLYKIGFQKQTPNKEYYFIDGGMTDNIRPCLYQAKYACDIANKMDEEKNKLVTIAGKNCESGDIIIKDAKLPKAETGDILVVYSTGAYGYSMSSNYNRLLTPAVVFVKDGKSREVVRRQTYEDLLRNDL